MITERAKMPGSIVGYAVLLQHCRVNLAGMLIPTNKPKTEAFRASEGLNASRIQVINNRGISLIELIVTMVILSVLALLILPSAQMAMKRNREMELRRDLRMVRTAIDDYKKNYDQAVAEKKLTPSMDNSGYPETLQVLVDGYDFGGLIKYKKKFLRRIPVDPFNPPKPGKEPEWGLRSYKDEPDSENWGGEDVYDIYSLSGDTAIDGTKYKDW